MGTEKSVDKIEDIAKRRGFFWRSSELYGGISGLYDYAHLGKMIKKRLENLWRSYFLGLDENFHEIEASYIVPENVVKASGHLTSFVDPIPAARPDTAIDWRKKRRVLVSDI